jgi:hypothetical protein
MEWQLCNGCVLDEAENSLPHEIASHALELLPFDHVGHQVFDFSQDFFI